MLVINVLIFAVFYANTSHLSMLTGQMGINATIATQITSMLNAGMDVWAIVGLLASFNVVGVGLLFTAKSMLKRLGTAAVVSW